MISDARLPLAMWIATVLGLLGAAYALADRDPRPAPLRLEPADVQDCRAACEGSELRLDGVTWDGSELSCVCSARGQAW